MPCLRIHDHPRGDAHRQPRRRVGPTARGARARRRSSPPRTPGSPSACSPALGIANRPKLIALHEHNERQKAAELVELARDDRPARAERRGNADGLRPRVPARRGRRRGRGRGHRHARPVARWSPRSPCRACPPTASPSRGSCRARPASAPAASPSSRATAAPCCSSRGRRGLAASLAALAEALRGRPPAAVCRELTKLYEEVAPRAARRTGRVGRGRGARRDRDRRRRRRRRAADPESALGAGARARGIRNPAEGRRRARRRRDRPRQARPLRGGARRRRAR